MVGLTDQRGFTLIEIVLAILVVSIAVVGATSAINFTASWSLNAEVSATAKELAQERMEQLMAMKRNNGYNDPAFNIGPTTLALTPLAAPFAQYSRGEQICLVDANLLNPDCDPAAPNNDAGYKKITVSVGYTGLPNLSPAATVVTLISNVRE